VGNYRQQEFFMRHCPQCHFSFIANPWTDYTAMYSDEYYAGKGADPLVDYEYELNHPQQTIRGYEWRGVVSAVKSLVPVGASTRWLDFGCGNGGLVRYCRNEGIKGSVGFEEGSIRRAAEKAGIPFLSAGQLKAQQGTFDVVTAIEVLEHVEDPLMALSQIRALLKPGGLFFYTTGNAQPYRHNLLQWRYVVPEIHISYYEPETLRQALLRTGFKAEFRGSIQGFGDIIRFKILKNIGFRQNARSHMFMPWPILTRLADARYHFSSHPIGWAAPAD
jgi:SAM-dependent methyltransferase